MLAKKKQLLRTFDKRQAFLKIYLTDFRLFTKFSDVYDQSVPQAD